MKFREFLPTSRDEMVARGWYYYDVLVVTGDAYVDHPSFGAAVIARVLEADGYRVAVLAQPSWTDTEDFLAMGRPRYAVLVGAGNLDSMVAKYTAAKKTRSEDFYSPGKAAGLRPDRASITYALRAREAFAGLPVIVGGLEASLRRFAHYDYWEDKVRRPVLFDAKADLLVYGMGETATREIVRRITKGEPVESLMNIRGTAYISKTAESAFPLVECESYEDVVADKRAYASANMLQYDEHDPVRGRAVAQKVAERVLIVNPPAMPLTTAEFDRISELPYMREPHPKYNELGGVPSIEEVRFSLIHNRGCFGACNFCSLAFHQGRMVTSRSHDSLLREVEEIVTMPDFKGYIHDVGGPTANFRRPSCEKQLCDGMCVGKNCLTPTPCKNLDADHTDYLKLLRKLSAVNGVKKVFVRSGIRFDYLLLDKNGEFFSELVKNHISGQLKVAPEHCIDSVLDYMGKPPNAVYNKFADKYAKINERYSKQQFLVPYLISSHPGSSLADAVALAEYLNRTGRQPEQVQDFYPTPGTLSTCMYHTGIDPRTMEEVYVPVSPREKAQQRALLQWRRPDKRRLVIEALRAAGREDLIGFGKQHLVRPDGAARRTDGANKSSDGKPAKAKSQGTARQSPNAPKGAQEARKPKPRKKKKGWA